MTTLHHRNIKRVLAATSIALAIPLSAAAFQGGPGDRPDCGSHAGHGGPGMGGGMMPHHLRGLNLSEAQRDKIFEIMHAQAPAMREKAKAERQAEDNLQALTSAGDYSEAKARALADTSAKAMSEMSLARARAERQVFEVLTPEQRKQLADMKASGGPGRGRGDGPRGMGGETSPPPAR
jgi:periplasmic protein CpxP/Spy